MKTRPRARWFGPLGWWELVRLARRGQGHRARLLVAYFLFVAFVLTPILWFPHADPVALFTSSQTPLPPRDMAAFGGRFATVLLEAILLAVAAMTPGYAATAVAEEKERDTLPLLLTTSLTDREIVLGKAVGRCGFVLAAVLAGVPVLAMTVVLGGVSPGFLLAGCGLVVGTAVLATAIGINAACNASDLRGALLRAYGLAAVLLCGVFVPPFVLASPFGVLYWLEVAGPKPTWLVLGGVGYPALQVLVALALFANAIDNLRDEPPLRRRPRSRPSGHRPRPVSRVRPAEPVRYDPAPSAAQFMEKPPALPRVSGRNPLLWKERYVTGRKVGADAQGGALAAGLVFAVLGVILVVVGGQTLFGRWMAAEAKAWNKPRPAPPVSPSHLAAATGTTVVGYRELFPPPPPPWVPPPDEGGRILMTGGVVFSGLFLVPIAIGLSAAVARERHRKTLDALFSIPEDRRVILRAKVRAVAERGWWRGPAAVAVVGTAFAVDGGLLLGLTAAAFVAAGGWLVVGLGVWLTVRCPTEVRALRFLVPVVVVVVGAPVGVWNSIDWYDPSGPDKAAVRFAVSAAGFALAGTALWKRAGQELDRLG
jgi:ABC-type Na+ efflux pump permease subunit